MRAKPKFDHVALIGTGLIGSSLALAMRENGLCDKIIGFDDNADAAREAQKLGVTDQTAKTIDDAFIDAALIIVATPVGAIEPIVEAINARASTGAVVIDVGSIKEAIVKAASLCREDVFFVPCHPVAGTEQSGPGAGFSTLFRKRWCILTPLERTDTAYLEAVRVVQSLWEAVGANVETMEASHHDLALAVTSHLPHLIAFTLIGAADDLESVAEAEIVKYSAGGFRDFTRIAASNPVMWRDVFLHNKDAVLETLGRFSEELAILQRAIRWGDGEALHKAFARGRDLRQAIVAAGQETNAPNFGRDE